MSKRKVIDFFKLKVSVQSASEEKKDEPPRKSANLAVIQQPEETTVREKPFHPTKDFVVHKSRFGNRDRQHLSLIHI